MASSVQLPEYPDRKNLVLIDGHALIYRAYHAFKDLSTSSGEPINAVYGFSRILLTALSDLAPEYIVVAFDSKGPTKRAEQYAEYKAHRPEMPEDLKPQIQRVKDVVEALNIPQFALPGVEADDLIGTVTAQVAHLQREQLAGKCEDLLSIVVTGDKDLLQLVDDCTHVWIPGRGKGNGDIEYDALAVEQKMGVTPEQIVDLKALMGDSSDNIPGVRGIGKKTACSLIQTFGSLDAVYAKIDHLAATGTTDPVLKGAVLTKLVAGKEDAYLSQQLARIDRNVPIEFELEKCLVTEYDKSKVIELFEELEFHSLISLLPKDDFELGVQDALW